MVFPHFNHDEQGAATPDLLLLSLRAQAESEVEEAVVIGEGASGPIGLLEGKDAMVIGGKGDVFADKGRGIDGMMDLDDIREFPVLGNSVGQSCTTDVVRDHGRETTLEEAERKGSSDAMDESPLQQGNGYPHWSGMKGWVNVVACSKDDELEDCPEARIHKSGDALTVIFPA